MNFYQLNELATQFRLDLGINHLDSIDFFPLVTTKIKNLTIVFLKMDDDISGACCKFDSEKIIFINSNHSKGRQIFTAAHELYHLYYDDTPFTICNVNSEDEVEKNADEFASLLIMPTNALYNYKKENEIKNWDLNSIIQCEQYFQISHEAMLYRLKSSQDISPNQYREFKPNIKYNASKIGYDLSLYEPFIGDNYTIGNYIRLVEELFEKDKISPARREEYLLDAFLNDLVYNLEEL